MTESGAKIVPFTGCSMPLAYGDVGQGGSAQLLFSSFVASHSYVRKGLGIFMLNI